MFPFLLYTKRFIGEREHIALKRSYLIVQREYSSKKTVPFLLIRGYLILKGGTLDVRKGSLDGIYHPLYTTKGILGGVKCSPNIL